MRERLFPANEHKVERVVRVAIGLVLIALAVTGPKYAWGWIGLLPLVTGLVGSCPAYTLLGVSTCKTRGA